MDGPGQATAVFGGFGGGKEPSIEELKQKREGHSMTVFLLARGDTQQQRFRRGVFGFWNYCTHEETRPHGASNGQQRVFRTHAPDSVTTSSHNL